MEDDAAGDIGLSTLSKAEDYFTAKHEIKPPKKSPRRPSALKLSPRLRRLSVSLLSPSLPDLQNVTKDVSPTTSRSPKSPRANGLGRSRTLPHSRRPSLLDSPALPIAPQLELDTLQKMRRWILLNFDLDIGPVVEGAYPSCHLSTATHENIAFSSFPDSTQFSEGSEVHSFRIREMPIVKTNEQGPKFHSQDGFLYGYVFFSRRRDSTVKRGYEQRSIVVLTVHPWPGLFLELVKRLGPLYLEHGGPIIEAACHNIAKWPDPTPGVSMEVGFLGHILCLMLTGTADRRRLGESPLSEKYSDLFHVSGPDLFAICSEPPFSLFVASLKHMWSIWECLILCEPILIFGNSPSVTSEAIWWLLDIIRPIPFAGDFRPYFTIHDKDHSLLVTRNPPKVGLIIGVTNPIFERTCKHWPHMLSLGKSQSRTRQQQSKDSHIVAGPAPGWKTKTHNRYISKDKELLRRLESYSYQNNNAETNMIASKMLHQHFSRRTAEFLLPLNRYRDTLLPSLADRNAARKVSSSQPTLRMRSFNQRHFLESLKLKSNVAQLPFRTGKQREFYERWLKSPAFGLWVAQQEEIVSAMLVKDIEH